MYGFMKRSLPAPFRNTAYPLTACRSANTCLTCSCPASRANFSVTYAHVALHPQEQVGRLTSRLPSFSKRTVTLWVTLMIFLLLKHRNPDTQPTNNSPSVTSRLPMTTNEKTTRVTVSPLPPGASVEHRTETSFARERPGVVSALRIRPRERPNSPSWTRINAGPRRTCPRPRRRPRRRHPHDGALPPPTRQPRPPRTNVDCRR